jgi:hypothetical protein
MSAVRVEMKKTMMKKIIRKATSPREIDLSSGTS